MTLVIQSGIKDEMPSFAKKYSEQDTAVIVRRVLIGSVCGMVSSLFLCLAVRNIGLGLALGALLGIAQIFAFFGLESGSAIAR